MAGKISEYTTEVTTLGNNDLIDVSVLVSTGPDVYDSQKLKYSTLKAQILLGGVLNGASAWAGGGQGSATSMSARYNRIDTVATAGDSVKTIDATVGVEQVIINDGANSCNVFPLTGDNFRGLAANAAFPLAAGSMMRIFCFATGTWDIIG